MELIFRIVLNGKKRRLYDHYFEKLCLTEPKPKKEEYAVMKAAAACAALARLGELSLEIDDSPSNAAVLLDLSLDA